MANTKALAALRRSRFLAGLDETTIPIAKQACPDIPYYLNVKTAADGDFDALAGKIEALGALGVNLDHRNATPELVRAMHDRGLLVSMWTIENKEEAIRALRMGADNITTYRPLLVRALELSLSHTLRIRESINPNGRPER